jgi:hypothetical protein
MPETRIGIPGVELAILTRAAGSKTTVPTYDFELTIEGDDTQIIRVQRKSLDEARIAAEGAATEFRNSTAGLKPYALAFIGEVRIADR